MAEPKNRSASTASATKTNNKPWGIIIGVIVAVIVVIAAVCAILFFANQSDDQAPIEDALFSEYLTNGNGSKIPAKYASVPGLKYKVLVPANFDLYDSAKLAAKFNNSDSTEMAYTNSNNSVNILFSKIDDDAEMSNDDVESYLEILETSYGQLDENIKTELKTIDGHNVGILEFVTEDVYNHIAFFSYNDKLALILFNCDNSITGEWKKVGDEIINSLKFE